MNKDDVAALVERLERPFVGTYADGTPLTIKPTADELAAASAIKALAARIAELEAKPSLPPDAAALVERLESEAERLQARTYSDRCTSPDCALASNVAVDAASAIKALAAENARLQGLIRDNGTPRFNEVCRRAEAAEAKLREAVELVKRGREANRSSAGPDEKAIFEYDARAFLSTMEAAAD